MYNSLLENTQEIQLMINEIGNKYTMLTVTGASVKRTNRAVWWECVCDCGNKVLRKGSSLRKGETTSCGCRRKAIVSERQSKNEQGNRYGKLIVLERITKDGGNGWVWLCLCDCGNNTEVLGTSLRCGNTKSCGCYSTELRSLEEGMGAFNALYSSYWRSAKKRRLTWSIDKDEFKSICKEPCFYCGGNPKQEYCTGRRGDKLVGNGVFVYNGIDRIDSSIGYIKDNIRPCCKHCNYAKHEMTEAEFISWIGRVYNRLCK